MEWLLSSVWKWTRKKNCVSLNAEGVSYFEAEACFRRIREKKNYIYSRAKMNCLILWFVIESHHPERNREEELIKDYSTADSQISINNLIHAFLNIYSMCGDI